LQTNAGYLANVLFKSSFEEESVIWNVQHEKTIKHKNLLHRSIINLLLLENLLLMENFYNVINNNIMLTGKKRVLSKELPRLRNNDTL